MNNIGYQQVNVIIEAFQNQVCGSSNIFVHEYEFHKRVQGSNESFEEFYNDLQSLLNKCQYRDCCKTLTRISCKDRILLARRIAGIKSNDVRKGLLCITDLTLEKAVQHIKVDEATSSQVDRFTSKINKTGASSYKQGKSPYNQSKKISPQSGKDECLKKCKFCMKFHVLKKDLCPAKDSICKVCHNKGHWAKSVMCPNTSNKIGKQSKHETKSTDDSTKSNPLKKPTLKVIFANGDTKVTPATSVKSIYVSTVPRVGKHYYAEFVIGNHNWKQKCIIDPGSNINCVGYDQITQFDIHAQNYNLECGSVKTVGGHNQHVDARALLKISSPPKKPVVSARQWFHIVHSEDGVIIGTPACQVLGIIDDQWPLSALTQNAPPPQSVKSLTAVEIPSPSNIIIHHKNQLETNSPESALLSGDDLLSNLNCITTRVSSLNVERKNITNSEDTNFSPISEAYEDVFNDATLPEIKGDSFRINLKPDTQPYA